MKRIVLMLSILLLSIASAYGHKSFISIADMEYNKHEKQIEVSLKLTAHDFEYILEQKFKTVVDIESVTDTSKIGLFIQFYIEKHFKIQSNSSFCKYEYVGKEVNVRDELFLYFTFKNVINPAKITVVNTFLFELFEKQQNIIHYRIGNLTKSVTLVAHKQKRIISFN